MRDTEAAMGACCIVQSVGDISSGDAFDLFVPEILEGTANDWAEAQLLRPALAATSIMSSSIHIR
jgi:hypothetical protein